MTLPGFTALTRPMIVNSATFFMALSTVGLRPAAMAFRGGGHRGGLHPSGPERREGAEGAGFFGAKRARGAALRWRGKKHELRLVGGTGDHRKDDKQAGARPSCG